MDDKAPVWEYYGRKNGVNKKKNKACIANRKVYTRIYGYKVGGEKDTALESACPVSFRNNKGGLRRI